MHNTKEATKIIQEVHTSSEHRIIEYQLLNWVFTMMPLTYTMKSQKNRRLWVFTEWKKKSRKYLPKGILLDERVLEWLSWLVFLILYTIIVIYIIVYFNSMTPHVRYWWVENYWHYTFKHIVFLVNKWINKHATQIVIQWTCWRMALVSLWIGRHEHAIWCLWIISCAVM